MSNFDSIRPYRDGEVRGVVNQLLASPGFADAAARLLAPRLFRWLPFAARMLARSNLSKKLQHCDSVADVQALVAVQLDRLVAQTTDGLTFDGLQGLDRAGPYLFISNHRDIALDSSFLNLVLYREGFDTCRVAVGDNLFNESFVSDIIRINKGFVVQRSGTGAKETYKGLLQTSQFIRSSMEEGQSVWIAQREGRAKDGLDSTEPALVKMLMLAYRKELETIGDYLQSVTVVPLSVTYELDPCDLNKARELATLARTGEYKKQPGEDLINLGLGITGSKGRVHYQFGTPMAGSPADAESWAAALDQSIVLGTRLYPTHRYAAQVTGQSVEGVPVYEGNPGAVELLEERIESAPEDIRPHVVAQYANTFQNVAERLKPH